MDTKVISMGLDAGFGAIKICSDGGSLELLSQVAVNGSGHLEGMLGLKSEKRPMMVTTSDGDFYVGAKAHDYGRAITNLDFDRLIGSPEMRALVYGAWSRYMQTFVLLLLRRLQRKIDHIQIFFIFQKVTHRLPVLLRQFHAAPHRHALWNGWSFNPHSRHRAPPQGRGPSPAPATTSKTHKPVCR